MKILVLGGAGYIGSHTVYALIEQGYDVAVADSLQTGHRTAVHPEARFHKGDVRDRAFMDGVLQREAPDAVIHFAANSLVGESMLEPLKYYDNNVGGTCALLASMAEQGVRRIVFSSTAAVYGEPERIPICEKDRTVPTNPYGETKLAMERMFHWADVAHGIKFVSLRYFNACGAHMSGCIGEAHAPETHLIPIVLQVPNGQRAAVNVFGNAGWHLRAGLHPCDGSCKGAYPCGAVPCRGRGKHRFQPWKWRGLHGAGDHPRGGARNGGDDPHHRRAAASGGPGTARRFRGTGAQRARLAAAVCGGGGDHRFRMALAQRPPGWLF